MIHPFSILHALRSAFCFEVWTAEHVTSYNSFIEYDDVACLPAICDQKIMQPSRWVRVIITKENFLKVHL